MKLQEKLDNTFDPWFRQHGAKLYTAVSFMTAILLALFMIGIATPAQITIDQTGDSKVATMSFGPLVSVSAALLLIIAIVLIAFDRYLRKYELRQKQTDLVLINGCFAIGIVTAILCLPGMPLDHYWSATPSAPYGLVSTYVLTAVLTNVAVVAYHKKYSSLTTK